MIDMSYQMSSTASLSSQWFNSQSQQFEQLAQQYQQMASQQQLQFKTMENKYKTELCKNWISRQECQYGSKCRFAHGKHELIERLAQNKGYKTKLCSAFHQEGVCLYAARCHFRHDERTFQDISDGQIYRKRLALLTAAHCNDVDDHISEDIQNSNCKNIKQSSNLQEAEPNQNISSESKIREEVESQGFKKEAKILLRRLAIFEAMTSDEETISTTAGSEYADDVSFSSGFLRNESPELTPRQIHWNYSSNSNIQYSSNTRGIYHDGFNLPPRILFFDQEI